MVIRYRYHPAWTCSGAEIVSYPVPEDPMGFICLVNPPSTVELHFEPLKSFVPARANKVYRGEKQ